MELQLEQTQVVNTAVNPIKTSATEQVEMKASNKVNIASSEHPETDQVTISEEAKEKSINDKNQAAMRKMLGNEDIDERNGEGKNTLDEQIAELQEKIAKLTTEIAQERRQGNEEKTKGMEAELVMLNAQLLQLIEQKMESEQ